MILEIFSIVLVLAYLFSIEAPIDVLYAAGMFAIAGAIEIGLKYFASGTLRALKEYRLILSKNDNNDAK